MAEIDGITLVSQTAITSLPWCHKLALNEENDTSSLTVAFGHSICELRESAESIPSYWATAGEQLYREIAVLQVCWKYIIYGCIHRSLPSFTYLLLLLDSLYL